MDSFFFNCIFFLDAENFKLQENFPSVVVAHVALRPCRLARVRVCLQLVYPATRTGCVLILMAPSKSKAVVQ